MDGRINSIIKEGQQNFSQGIKGENYKIIHTTPLQNKPGYKVGRDLLTYKGFQKVLTEYGNELKDESTLEER